MTNMLLEKKQTSILIGNGFNSAIFSFLNKNSNKFCLDYNSIFNKMIENEKKGSMHQFFSFLKDEKFTNIENIISIFDQATVEFFNKNDDVSARIMNELRTSIASAFLDIMIESHPSYNEIFPAIEKSDVFTNIATFESIYSLNFDIILYWLIMSDEGLTEKFSDGFSQNVHNSNCNQFNNKIDRKLLFLHGALHIFFMEASAVKFKKSDKTSLLNFIKNELKNSISKKNKCISLMNSSVVLGGNVHDKIKKIENHPYLNTGVIRLKNETNDIVVYGCDPFANIDSHVWDAISESHIKKIYIGIHDEDLNIDPFKENVRNEKWHGKEIYFFNSKNINICNDRFLEKIFDTAKK